MSNNHLVSSTQYQESSLWPPCRVACPVHADVQKYVGLIAQDKTQEALDVIRETTLFAAVCGRICPHPCEEACRRGQVDEPVAICSLKRFAADSAYPNLKVAKSSKKIDKKIAVIGAGPSGLTAAYDLTVLGYKVTVFEKHPEPGGMLRYGVPRYRLPIDALMQDIEPILKSGVRLKTGTEVGKDITLDGLEKRGYEAIFVAAGTHVDKKLGIAGEDLRGVISAVGFLHKVNSGEQARLGKKVVVIGGGDVAMDCARTALRLGSEVLIVYRRSRKEMPAGEVEIREAKLEGVKFEFLAAPVRVEGRNGKVSGVKCVRMKLGELDESGRRRPVPVAGSEFRIEADYLIPAIGQIPDASFLLSDIGTNPDGTIKIDPETLVTTKKGIFAGGDMVTGPGLAIEAIASGRKAALAIDAYLKQGKIEPVELYKKDEVGELTKETVSRVKKIKREQMPKVAAGKRVSDFDQFELGFKDNQAMREAQRCLSCTKGAEVIMDKCTTCLTCIRICPYDVPYIEDGEFAGVDVSQCQSCGICSSECPAKAIELKFASEDEILGQAREVLKKASSHKPKSPILGIICQYSCNFLDDTKEEASVAEEIAQVKVLCTGRIGSDTYLKFFEMGAYGVIVAVCPDEECRYNDGRTRTEQRVVYTRSLLEQAGLAKERLQMGNISFKLKGKQDQCLKVAVDRIKK